jgi:hypothetical protein
VNRLSQKSYQIVQAMRANVFRHKRVADYREAPETLPVPGIYADKPVTISADAKATIIGAGPVGNQSIEEAGKCR